MKLKEKVVKALSGCRVKPGSRILVALSGGPDSTTLVYVLKNLLKEYRFTIFAACLDHGLRKKGEVDKEIALVRQLAAELHIELFIGRVPGGELSAIARKEGRSLEEVAREKRYQFLEAVRQKIKGNYIAVGHIADDHIETMVMRFFQGGGVSGLAGIPIARDYIIRPLYYCTKEEVLDYVEKQGIPFSIDSSNLSKAFLRNKIRLNLIPVVKNIFPGYIKGLTRLSGMIHLLGEYLDEQVDATCEWEKRGGGYCINGDIFLSVHPIIRLFSLYKMLNTFYNEEQVGKKERIPFRFLSIVLDPRDICNKKVIIKGYGIVLLWEGRILFCKPDIVYPFKKGYLICVKNGETINALGMGCTISIYNDNIKKPSTLLKAENKYGKREGNSSIIYLSEKCIHYPLVVRSRIPGDKIGIAKGTKSLKKIMNEWKVPEKERCSIPVLAHRKGILAVLGKEFGYKDQYSSEITRNINDRASAGDNETGIMIVEIKKGY